MLKDNLKQFRRNNNMSQEELASKVCVSRSSIALYEKGIRKPSIETIKLICTALNIKIEDLTIQEEELTEARWFSMQDLQNMVDTKELNPNQIACFVKCVKFLEARTGQ